MRLPSLNLDPMADPILRAVCEAFDIDVFVEWEREPDSEGFFHFSCERGDLNVWIGRLHLIVSNMREWRERKAVDRALWEARAEEAFARAEGLFTRDTEVPC